MRCFVVCLSLLTLFVTPLSAANRVRRGLQVLYTFAEGKGKIVHDRSGVGEPLHLQISTTSSVHWRSGALVVRAPVRIRSQRPATKIFNAVRRSQAITIEAWVQSADARQEGPARIVSLSRNGTQRNFTLAQDKAEFDVRFRTRRTTRNGIPSTSTRRGVIKAGRLLHVIYTRQKSGTTRIYVNGKNVASRRVSGNPTNWDRSYPLLLANENKDDRPWRGSLHLVAVYGTALTAKEVVQNFQAGPQTNRSGNRQADLAQFFETRIAPILARRCIDCHDSTTSKGKLNLATRDSAFAGGKSGKVIVPKNASASLLWRRIAAGTMPKGSKRLSKEEVALFKKWIDRGATWSLKVLDPAVYAHGKTNKIRFVRRLTVDEYIETVRSTLGVNIAKEARSILPADLRADGFRNTAYNLNVDLKHVRAYAKLAQIIVSRMDVLKYARQFSRSRSLNTDATARKFIAALGKRILRGPLTDREVTNFSGIATTVASAGGSFQEGVGYIIEAMIQSPRFIYLIENQRGDGTAWPVGPYELASRLSYIIWGGPPDKQLMKLADSGQLTDPQVVAEQAQRMLRDKRAESRSVQFVSQWLQLSRLDSLQPNKKRFPNWDPQLAKDMKAETIAFFREVAWRQRRPLSDLFRAQFTFATPRLAQHYGLTPQAAGLQKYDLSKVSARGGLLTQGSTLTVGGDDASMVTRGLFIFHDILRGMVKDPPPTVDTTPVPAKPGISQRQISEGRLKNVSCKGCHAKFEPLAFALEKYDGIGAFREKDEHGNQLREDGVLRLPGVAKSRKYRNAAELMSLLAGSERVSQSLTWKATQFALGRPLGPADVRRVQAIHQAAKKGGGTYSALIVAIVTSDLVLMTQTQK